MEINFCGFSCTSGIGNIFWKWSERPHLPQKPFVGSLPSVVFCFVFFPPLISGMMIIVENGCCYLTELRTVANKKELWRRVRRPFANADDGFANTCHCERKNEFANCSKERLFATSKTATTWATFHEPSRNPITFAYSLHLCHAMKRGLKPGGRFMHAFLNRNLSTPRDTMSPLPP